MHRLLPLLGAVLLCGTASAAQHNHAGGARADCTEPTLACASAATPFLTADGTLWLAWAAAGQVSVARSDDHGKRFAPPVALLARPATLDTGPDARPKLVVDRDGRITVAYAVFKDQRYNGQVFVTRSTDGGRSFAVPRPITDDPASQRFEALALDADGGLFAAWLDKRNGAAARKKGTAYAGAALAFAWADADGATIGTARIAQDQTCECCRLGVAFAAPGRPVLVFRHIFAGGVRDHALLAFADRTTPGALHRVSADDWQIDACPHQGPSLAIAPDGAYHVAWFTDGKARQGLFYARSSDSGASFSAPMPIGDNNRQPARPAVLAAQGSVWLAWKEFDGERSTALAMRSRDGGATWSAPAVVARTDNDSDHPLLVADRSGAYLSWLTRNEGYRLLPLQE